MSPQRPSPVPRLRSDVRYRVVGGQAVVIVQDRGEALVLNEVGSRFLELVDGARSLDEIRDRMHEEFDAERDELVRDLETFLLELTEAGILAADDGPPTRPRA